jgi:glycerol-3-phosphate O-acyltransferase
MSNDRLNSMRLMVWLATPLMWLVRPRVVPAENPAKELGIDPTKPVLYVLPTASLIDRIVLYRYCKQFDLPTPDFKPRYLGEPGKAAYLYLTKLGLLQPLRDNSAPPPLSDLVARAQSDKSLEVQLVPVSIIWGRDPARREKSLFKLVFADDEHAGLIQKVLIVIAQGRDTLLNIGKPISLRQQVDAQSDNSETARKLRRVLRVHFRQHRQVSLGPKLYDRAEVIGEVLRTKSVQQAIDRESEKDPGNRRRIELKAQRYVKEITAEPTHGVVRFLRAILHYLWQKIFHGIETFHSEYLRELAEKYEVVFMSCHRSHIDYLLLSYVVFEHGMVPPHTAAGINLNFWPIGSLLRRGGAFFLRRKFGGNRLYTAVFNEYVNFLVRRGHALNFFPEGGRSRTGRLLPPKTGMLAMILNGYVRSRTKPIAILPVYVGYDHVVEVKSYLRELQGGKKRPETIGQLLGARKVLRKRYGKAYVNFAKPIMVDEFLDQHHPQWRNEDLSHEAKPPWLSRTVDELADQGMSNINDAVVVSPIALTATAMLASPKRAMAESELLKFLDVAIKIIRSGMNFESGTISRSDPKDIVAFAEEVSSIKRFKYPGNDVLHLNEADAVVMSYYRNNIIHVFTLPSLIANFFLYQEEVNEQAILDGVKSFLPFLKREFFLLWNEEQENQFLRRTLDAMVENGLLIHVGGSSPTYRRPIVAAEEYGLLKIMAGILQTILERYGITLAILGSFIGRSAFKRVDFEQQCQLLAQRISILSGANDPEYYDKSLFKNFVDMLADLRIIQLEGKNSEDITCLEGCDLLVRRTSIILSQDVRESITRATSI